MTKVQRKSLSRSPSLEQLFCTQDQRLCSTPWELEYPVPWHRCLALGLGLETFLGNNIETKMVNERYDLELSCFISLNAGGEGLSSRITQAHTPRFPIFESSVPYSQAQVDKMFSNQSWYVRIIGTTLDSVLISNPSHMACVIPLCTMIIER